MGKIIGIDLGTTNSAVAVYEGDKATIIENLNGGRTTPSVVAYKTKKDKKTKEVTAEWIVGASAKNQAAMNPEGTFYGVKRLIGRKADDAEVAKMKEMASYKITEGPNGDAWVELKGDKMAPPEISAKVLRDLKQAAEARLGEEVTEAVITVPAYFNDAQRQATRDAGKIAGLEVKRIINEPTAAALAYGMDQKEGGKIAVFDLGGGTFDVSILEVLIDEEEGNLIKVMSTNGDTFLGGENFDERITQHLIDALQEEHGVDDDKIDASIRQRIRDEAEKVKKELSTQDSATVRLPFLMPDDDGAMINFEYDMTRNKLEDLLRDLVEATIEPCKKALADAGLEPSDLDEVILVGGQTRMPLVIETVKGYFGKEPHREVNPDEIVAMGASVQGAILDGQVDNVLLMDVIPLSIGIKATGDQMSVMVPRNTSIPCEIKDVFSTARDMQTDVCIEIYQGERPVASDNRKLGKFVLDGIPPAAAGEPQIEVSLNIDADGVLNVSATDLKTNRAQKITVQANGGLDEDQVAEMLKDAEAHAEQDQLVRALSTAKAEADDGLKGAEADRDQEYFKEAPDELKDQFEAAVKELTEARKQNDPAVMSEKTTALKDIRLAIGKAFAEAAQQNTAAEESNDNDAPTAEATADTDAATPAEGTGEQPKKAAEVKNGM
ncbi:MAG: molecular chaperone DnaK [Alphaproteobacteria bacterium]|nr:molecular chaperone DnaK [Alphaproteobacteria bacterium]